MTKFESSLAMALLFLMNARLVADGGKPLFYLLTIFWGAKALYHIWKDEL